jgi:hypothetical protein
MMKTDHLALARKYLAVAESKDSKREAYKRAAKEIVAYKNETRESDAAIAIALGGGRSGKWVETLRRWAREGFKGETPFLADGKATERAALSHARKVLREAPIEEVEKALLDLPEPRRRQIQNAALQTAPALRKKPGGLGIPESIKRYERNIGFYPVMMGPLAKLMTAVDEVQREWDEHAEDATEEHRELVEEDIRNQVARLLALVSDPRELLA